MPTPDAEISVNGKPVASIFNERLISVTIVDKEGATSDTISLELVDSNPFAEIPRKGDLIEAKLGYAETGLSDFGKFTADDPEIRCLPYGLTVNGKAADMRETLKQHKSRHWDEKTVKDVVTAIAGEHSLTPQIDSDVGQHKYGWIGQEDESDLHFLERLADRHGALFSIKSGNLIFAAKGSGKSPSGQVLTQVVATPANIVVGSCRVKFGDRSKVKKVKGRVQDRDKAKLIEIEVESDSEGSAIHTLPSPYADEAEARQAATAKAKELKRQTITTSVTLYGDPAIRAGALFFYDGVRPEIDEIDFIIESASHKLTKSGYTVDVEAKLYVPGGAGQGGGGSGTGGATGGSGTAAGNDAGGGAAGVTTAPVAQDSQSLRPPQFQSPRSLGPNNRL